MFNSIKNDTKLIDNKNSSLIVLTKSVVNLGQIVNLIFTNRGLNEQQKTIFLFSTEY